MIVRIVPSLALIVSTLAGPVVQATEVSSLLQAAGFTAIAKPMLAIDFTLHDSTGTVFNLHDQQGKVVLINFWATWCPPCIHEMPMMEQLYQSRKHQPFALWAINMQESASDVADFMRRTTFHFPALVDPKGDVSARYMVRGLPTTYLIDCRGKMLGSIVGMMPWTSPATAALLDALVRDTACQPTAVTLAVPGNTRQ